MIKLAVFDFDGVFTNGIISFDDEKIIKNYNIKDGMGINILKNHNIEVIILSGFKENNSQKYILEHLKIECYFDCQYKKKKLLEIARLKNINLDEISYMGDDINDIELLLETKISGCPYDAIEECKNICDYISSKKGGDGCVRDFCNYILSYNSNINNDLINNDLINNELINNELINNELIKQIKKNFYYQINRYDFKNIDYLTNKIITTNKTNKIYFSGVGKSENMAFHLCSLLKSINIQCFNLDCLNIIHGDIGTIKKDDLIIFFSRSGNTEEIISIIDYLKKKECFIYCISCTKNSKYEKHFDKMFIIPYLKEIEVYEMNKIPTNSCMSQLIFSNILLSNILLKNNFELKEYKKNHPGGDIGFSIKKIKDIIINKYPKIIIDNEIEIIEILLEMNKFNIGCCFFFDINNIFIGILTDSDIRNLFTKNIKIINKKHINTNYKFEDNLEKNIIDCIKKRYIPIIIKNNFAGYIEFPL